MRDQPWVVVNVKPNQHTRAGVNARQQGYQWYVPRGLFRSPRTGTLREEPLFPGYAFARHPNGLWVSLSGTFGITSVMMLHDGGPARVPAAEIDTLRAREDDDGLVRLEAREFKVGEEVHVTRGAVTLDAIVDGMAGRDRVWVLWQILGGARTAVDVKDITRK